MKKENINCAELILLADHLSNSDALCQLAEECDELSHAGLKLRRTLSQSNPTPVSIEEAVRDLAEETADVMVALLVLGAKGFVDVDVVDEIVDHKQTRWLARVLSNETPDE